MTLQAISLGQKSDTATSFQTQPQKWNGRSVFVADSAYLKKQTVEAGATSNMFDGALDALLQVFISIGAIVGLGIGGIIGGIAAGIVTGSWSTALIVMGACGAGALIALVAANCIDKFKA